MRNLEKYLLGGDLRSKADVELIFPLIKNQNDFNELFEHLFSGNRLIVMRAADAIEKITRASPEFLKARKEELLKFLDLAKDKEFKWHLALLVSRIHLSTDEFQKVWRTLNAWFTDRSESKIVRVNALQGLFNLSRNNEVLKAEFDRLIHQIKFEDIPSLNSRIAKLKNEVRQKEEGLDSNY